MVDYYYQKQGVTTSKVIDLPFSFSSAGNVTVVESDSNAAWRNKILTVLMTDTGSRVWYDRFGASLSTLTFENISDIVAVVKDSIAEAIGRWIPEITLEDVMYNYDSGTGTFTVTVLYRLPSGTQDRVSLKQESITSSGDSLQVVWNG